MLERLRRSSALRFDPVPLPLRARAGLDGAARASRAASRARSATRSHVRTYGRLARRCSARVLELRCSTDQLARSSAAQIGYAATTVGGQRRGRRLRRTTLGYRGLADAAAGRWRRLWVSGLRVRMWRKMLDSRDRAGRDHTADRGARAAAGLKRRRSSHPPHPARSTRVLKAFAGRGRKAHSVTAITPTRRARGNDHLVSLSRGSVKSAASRCSPAGGSARAVFGIKGGAAGGATRRCDGGGT